MTDIMGKIFGGSDFGGGEESGRSRGFAGARLV